MYFYYLLKIMLIILTYAKYWLVKYYLDIFSFYRHSRLFYVTIVFFTPYFIKEEIQE